MIPRSHRSLVLIVLSVFTVTAQSAKAITLSEAIETTIQNNAGIKSQEAMSAQALHMVSAAKAGFMPDVEISENYSRTNNPMYAFGALLNQGRITERDFDPSSLNDPDPINNFRTSIRLRQPLYDGGRLSGQLTVAEGSSTIAKQKLERFNQELTSMVIETWFNLRILKELTSVLTQSIRLANENLTITKDKVELGMALESDILDMTIHREITRQELNVTTATSKTLLSTLSALLGAPADSLITPQFGNYGIHSSKQTLAQLQKEGVVSRPDLKAITAQIETARGAIATAKAVAVRR